MLKVVITGGSEGLGLELCKIFAQKTNCRIITCGRRKLEDVCALKNLINILYQQIDLSKDIERQAFIQFVFQEFGLVDILINNAVTCYDTDLLHKNDLLSFNEHFYLNSFIPIDLSLRFYNNLKQNKSCSNHCSFIMINSESAIQPLNPHLAYYAASKAALLNLTRSLALAVVDNINFSFCTLMLGPLATPYYKEFYKDKAQKLSITTEELISKKMKQKFPGSSISRLITPLEVAESILYLHGMREAKNAMLLKLDAGTIPIII